MSECRGPSNNAYGPINKRLCRLRINVGYKALRVLKFILPVPIHSAALRLLWVNLKHAISCRVHILNVRMCMQTSGPVAHGVQARQGQAKLRCA